MAGAAHWAAAPLQDPMCAPTPTHVDATSEPGSRGAWGFRELEVDGGCPVARNRRIYANSWPSTVTVL